MADLPTIRTFALCSLRLPAACSRTAGITVRSSRLAVRRTSGSIDLDLLATLRCVGLPGFSCSEGNFEPANVLVNYASVSEVGVLLFPVLLVNFLVAGRLDFEEMIEPEYVSRCSAWREMPAYSLSLAPRLRE